MDASTETKSKKKSSDRKLEILRTLVRMMTESENKHITTKSLAAAIGVSEAALYRHFPSKTKMYEEIICRELCHDGCKQHLLVGILRFGTG